MSVTLDSKKCNECQESKALEDFHYNKRSADGRQWKCKPCTSKVNSVLTNKGRLDTHMRHKYGISLAEYNAMLLKQNNSCAICERPNRGPHSTKRLYIDHDHETGDVRGLLCHNCNSAVGMFDDSPTILMRAVDYLGGL